jgi:ribosome-associated toxin RatA of RatAB toxin-antitoxin module
MIPMAPVEEIGQAVARATLQLLIVLWGYVGADGSFAAVCAEHAQFVDEGALSAHAWEFYAETDGVRAYNRKAPSSNIQEVLAKAIIDHPPERLFAVISDYDRYADFMPYVKRSESVRTADGVRWVFQHLVFPFPISDRHYTIKLSALESRPNDGFYCIQWTLDKQESVKRAAAGITPAFNDGLWILRRLEASKTDVTYFLHTDPSGWLPSWMINMANREALPAVLQAVRQRAAHQQTERSGADPPR